MSVHVHTHNENCKNVQRKHKTRVGGNTHTHTGERRRGGGSMPCDSPVVASVVSTPGHHGGTSGPMVSSAWPKYAAPDPVWGSATPLAPSPGSQGEHLKAFGTHHTGASVPFRWPTHIRPSSTQPCP
uniref:Uncharacterized protein n=1 Tax=Eutreptiella gymnastica TaxID=73025 RepID=A0A7S4LG84_9EUGL